MIQVVKLQAKKAKPSGTQYLVTVPSDLIKELGWKKGDKLIARVMEIQINGTKKKTLVYYKP
ncbi:MAG: hypothetical protein GSR85_11790 [Desulfurococcales archaeon]|nr:hypothetical protein [Desulfurococcales archaeon]